MQYRLNQSQWRVLTTVFVAGLLLVLVLAGCGMFKKKDTKQFEPGQAWLEDMRSHINKSISDNDRKSRLLEVVNQFELELRNLDRSVQRYYQKLIAVDAEYESTADDFRRAFQDLNQEKKVFRKRFMDLRFKMVDLTTPDEWNKLADISSKDTLFLNWQRKLEIQ